MEPPEVDSAAVKIFREKIPEGTLEQVLRDTYRDRLQQTLTSIQLARTTFAGNPVLLIEELQPLSEELCN